jgi:predicted nuclease of predicted toxin-antitoxin system
VRLLLDQDVYAVTARFLKEQGHDVVVAAELGLATAPDTAVLDRARAERRVLVTRDNDYGHLVFVDGAGPGVVRLVITPETVQSVHGVLRTALSDMDETSLLQVFVVIEADKYRVRKPV